MTWSYVKIALIIQPINIFTQKNTPLALAFGPTRIRTYDLLINRQEP